MKKKKQQQQNHTYYRVNFVKITAINNTYVKRKKNKKKNSKV